VQLDTSAWMKLRCLGIAADMSFLANLSVWNMGKSKTVHTQGCFF